MRWKCDKHKTYCYIAHENYNSPHVQMDPRLWGIWASKIENTKAIYDYPPRTKEFNDAIEEASNPKRRGVNKTAIQSSEFSDDLPQQIQIYTIAPPTQPTPSSHFPRRYSDPVASPSKKLIKKPKRDVVEVLRECGYDTKDFNGRGLKEFLTWCQCKDPDEDFDVVCEKLQKAKLGLDLLGDIEPAILTARDIQPGTAIRIIKSLDEWLESIISSIY
jgi:hypothetical protein